MKAKALLFGLNYAHCKNSRLQGCINDTVYMSAYIKKKLNIPTTIYTDDVDIENTSYAGLIINLYELSIASYKEDLEFVWIHYSGHGSNQKDTSGDEDDGTDEGIVPSDYETKGILIDDYIKVILSSFNPKTKILFICDACHSGSIADLSYTWDENGKKKIVNPESKTGPKILLISGCMDNQTSADAYGLIDENKSVGALSASILKVFKENPESINNVFTFVKNIRNKLKSLKYDQYPILSSTYDLTYDFSLFVNDGTIISQPINSSLDTNITNYTDIDTDDEIDEKYYKPPSQQYQPTQQSAQQYLQYHQYQQYKPSTNTYYKPPQQQSYYNTPQKVYSDYQYKRDLPQQEPQYISQTPHVVQYISQEPQPQYDNREYQYISKTPRIQYFQRQAPPLIQYVPQTTPRVQYIQQVQQPQYPQQSQYPLQPQQYQQPQYSQLPQYPQQNRYIPQQSYVQYVQM